MFVISDVHKLRVSISVPEAYAPEIRIGDKATVTAPAYPRRAFPAVVEASARAVNVASGATHMQLTVDNTDGALMPGGSANVHVDLIGGAGSFRLPVSALIFDQGGLRVATVGAGDRVALKTVIAAPPDGVAEGDQVRIADPGQKPVAAVAGSAKGTSGD